MAPTLIFVPGAWHRPETWSKVTGLLPSHTSVCVDLPTNKGSGYSFKDDVEAVQAAIQSASDKVVIIVHSYGSMPGSSGMNGLVDRVAGFIMISTGFTETGVSFREKLGGQPPPFAEIQDGECKIMTDTRELFYHDLAQAEGEQWVGKLTKFSADAYDGGEHAYAGWKEVPTWYLATTEDKAFPVEVQRMSVQQVRDEGHNVTLREVAASHSPMLSKPRETAAFIKEAVASFV